MSVVITYYYLGWTGNIFEVMFLKDVSYLFSDINDGEDAELLYAWIE